MDNNPAKFFDNILKFLSSDYNRIFTIEEVVLEVYKKQIVENNNNNNNSNIGLDGIFADKYYESNVLNAVMFLNSQGFVAYNEINKTVLINTKGFVKIKTEGFAKEIQNKEVNLWLQRSTWFCSIIALGLSVYTIFFNSKNYDSSTNVSNRSDKYPTTKVVPQQKDKIEVKKLE